MAAAVTGVFFGFVQLLLIRTLIPAVTGGHAARAAALVFAKLLLWGLFFAAAVLLFRGQILQIGTGAAGGMVAGGFAAFLYMNRGPRAQKQPGPADKEPE